MFREIVHTKIREELKKYSGQGKLNQETRSNLIEKYKIIPLTINDFRRLKFDKVVFTPNPFGKKEVYMAKINLDNFGNYRPDWFYLNLLFDGKENNNSISTYLNFGTKLGIFYEFSELLVVLHPDFPSTGVFDDISIDESEFAKRLDLWNNFINDHNHSIKNTILNYTM